MSWCTTSRRARCNIAICSELPQNIAQIPVMSRLTQANNNHEGGRRLIAYPAAVSKAPKHAAVDPLQFLHRPYPDARTIH